MSREVEQRKKSIINILGADTDYTKEDLGKKKYQIEFSDPRCQNVESY